MKNIQDIYPLSPLQQGILFHSLYDQNAGMHFMQMGFKLRGALNTSAFERPWKMVVDRHTALRTAFVWEEVEEPLQVVYRKIDLPISHLDWNHLSSNDQDEHLQEYLHEDRSRGFSLSDPPLIRLAIINIAENRYQCILSCHHILIDGWALNQVLGEVLTSYLAMEANTPLQLPPARPYSEYIAWLQRQDMLAAEAYWRRTLSGFIAPTQLQIGTVRNTEGESLKSNQLIYAHLPAAITQRLHAIAQEETMTLNVILQGAWGLLLSRYSGETDVIFGATVAARPSEIPGAEAMVGLFVNTLPVRIQIDADKPVSTWLRILQQQQAEARQHDYSSLIQIQQWSEVPPGVPLFESIMAFENFPVDNLLQLQQEKLQIEEWDLFDYTNYPLDLEVVSGPELTFRLHYDQRRYTDEEAVNILGHLREILTSIATNPDQLLQTVSMVTPAEKDALLNSMNGVQATYPDVQVIHELFEEAATKHPQKTAVIYRENRLSFAELNTIANQLAYRLIESKIAPGQFVGLLLERSHHAVIGILATFKSGGAYVPLDPKYPRERIHIMMEDAAPRVLVIQSWLRDLVPDSFEGEIIEIDHIDLSNYPDTNPGQRCATHDVAYLLYTSGTTGRPKGVLLQHDTYIRTCLNYKIGYQLDSFTPVSMNLGSISFGVFNGDMARSIFIGATLVICPDDIRLELDSLYELIKQEQVNIFESTPVLINAFLNNVIEEKKDLDWFRVLISSADAWRTVDYRSLRDRLSPHIRLINEYGMTEATHDSTFYEEIDGHHPDLPYVSIGKPFPNVRLYILDQYQQLIPRGFIGELYIAGPFLARGYLHQEELTRQRFLPDPFVPGGRMYKTGDLARWLSDGNVEFLGRADHQVKLRGFRIELGEIESVLRQHPSVKDTIVLAREDSTGDKQLIAYFTSQEKNGPTPAELHALVKQHLPEYMVPAAFVLLEALPLSSNGKINRLALPSPESSAWTDQVQTTHARTPTEEIVANVWSNILQREITSVTQTFFELGGHSLLAIRVISQLRENFQVEIPIRNLFEQPTVAGLATIIDSARATQQQLPAPAIVPASREGFLPLSFSQQRLWFIQQLDPESAAYNTGTALRLTGKLDHMALEQSINIIKQRHETLRTTFFLVDGVPHQRIAPFVSQPLSCIDLQAHDPGERESKAWQIVNADAAQPFDLEVGPLLRIILLRLDEDDHVLSIIMHHIISDEWSLNLFIHELATLYGDYCTGTSLRLSELPIQYADYAIWQRQWLQAEVLEYYLAYWRKQLGGDIPPLDLPTDRPRPHTQTSAGALLRCTISESLLPQLHKVSQQEDVTLFMFLLAAFKILLHQYTRQTDILVGVPIAGRGRAETEDLIGCFINTLVLRTNQEGDPTCREFLKQVSKTALDAYTYEAMPFEMLVEELQPTRDLSRNPLFQVMFNFEPAAVSELDISGLKIEEFAVERRTSKLDLTLFLSETEQGLVGIVEYNTDLFDATTIQRMMSHFEQILTTMVANLDQQISNLSILTSAEQELLDAFNATIASYPTDLCIPDLIEAQVARTPNAIAAIFEEERITYAELDRRTIRLASYLQKLGVDRETLVGVYMDRSLDMLVALISILKAGGAYIPIDPSYPAERVTYILGDTQASLVLTQSWLCERLSEYAMHIIIIDTLWNQLEQGYESKLSIIQSDNLAYVIYTSGSTGKPKGVAITHRSVVNFLTAIQQQLQLTERDRVFSVTTISFDIAVLELILPLTVGASVMIASHAVISDGDALIKYLANSGATLMQATPSTWRLLLEAGWQGDNHMKILCGGEELPIQLANILKPLGAALWNLYGPTETTIWSMARHITSLDGPISLGKPIANTQIYLLDEQFHPVPLGVPGELYIGGAGLARGYLNRPDLTAERFAPDPFNDIPDARLYCTGDLARLKPDGNLEYIGRTDNQVKVRGYRIELGEIEAVLQQHPAIRDTVVTVREGSSGYKQLVAYITSMTREPISVEDLRHFLHERLPEYMIPAFFMMLDEMPLTANGKLNRQALPDPHPSEMDLYSHYIAPRERLEIQLTQQWEDLLEIQPIGVRDNFFSLGGNSLLVVSAIARIERHLGKRIPLTTFFQFPTIEGLTGFLRQQIADQPSTPLVPLNRNGSNQPFFCVHPVSGNIFSYVDLAHKLGPDQPFYALQSPGIDGGPNPTSIEEMAANYISAIRTIQPHGPYHLGGWSMGGIVALEMAQQLHRMGDEIALLALFDSSLPMYTDEVTSDADLVQAFAFEMFASIGKQLALPDVELKGLVRDEQIQLIFEQARKHDLLPPDIGFPQIEQYLETYMLNQRALVMYRPSIYPGQIALFHALENIAEDGSDASTNWATPAAQSIVYYPIEGNHYTMLKPPYVQALAEQLRQLLHTVMSHSVRL
jgi:amino acid adenylation domain-containing protein